MKKTLRYFTFALVLVFAGLAFQQCAEPQEQVAPAEVQKKNAPQLLSPYVSVEGIEYKLNISEQDAASLGVAGEEFHSFAQRLALINEAAANRLAEDPDAKITLYDPNDQKGADLKEGMSRNGSRFTKRIYFSAHPNLLPSFSNILAYGNRPSIIVGIYPAYGGYGLHYQNFHHLEIKLCWGVITPAGNIELTRDYIYYHQYNDPILLDYNTYGLLNLFGDYIYTDNTPYIGLTGGGYWEGPIEDIPCSRPTFDHECRGGIECPYYSNSWVQLGPPNGVHYFELFNY